MTLMRKASDKIWELIGPAVEDLGYELVGIEHVAQGRHSVLRIYIDQPQGITVDDCAAVSHQVSGVLDVEDPIKGNYTLEVSSPGMDRPLFTLEQFANFAGELVKLRTHAPVEGRRNFSGQIKGLDGECVEIVVDDMTIRLTLDEIDTARLVPVFE